MNEYARHHKIRISIAVGLVILLTMVFAGYILLNKSGKVLPTLVSSDDVTVTATVQNCELSIRVYPEKRIPRTGNWGTILQVVMTEINGGAEVLNYSNLVTDSNGEGTIDLCSESVVLVSSSYDFYITGESHLRKYFPNVPYDPGTGFVNLTVGGVELLAGDTNNPKDNEVNSLDVSTQIFTLYGGDSRNDFNKDTKVNSLEFSNTSYNYYRVGD